MIRGYSAQPSPRPGGSLTLHVATDAPRFRVYFYRWGAQATLQEVSEWLPGQDAPAHLPFQDWSEAGVDLRGDHVAPWPGYDFPVPSDWPSGVYVAVLVEGDADGEMPGRLPGDDEARHRQPAGLDARDARDARALFVVRSAAPGHETSIVYKVPLLTYHAYNVVDGGLYDPATASGQWCLYNLPRRDELPEPVPEAVSLHRPGGGSGGVPYDLSNFDPFDPTPRQTFVHWDALFVGWLERAGYQVDYCTDVDLHREGAGVLAPYRLLLSCGHDEYYSDAMRTAVESFVTTGGNAAFFGGNTCWWRVVFDEECSFRRVHRWWEPDSPCGPENELLGVSFRNGGERDRDEHPLPVGYRVQHAGHWVYAGTEVRDGDVFGDGPKEYLVGYECDGADFDRADLLAGRPVTPTGEDGTPPSFTILGVGDTRPSGWGFGNCAATLGLHTPGGTVFTAATTDWVRVLARGSSPVVERITRNVLERLCRA